MPGSRAITLDGSNGMISFGDVFRFVGRAPFSVEVWAWARTVGPDVRFLFSRRTTAGGGGFSAYFNRQGSSQPYILAERSGDSDNAYASGPGFTTTAFDHIVITYDGTTLRQWMNGVEVASATHSAMLPDGVGTFVVGDVGTGQFFKFLGVLDELAVYDKALPAAAIQKHLAIGLGQ